MTAAIVREYLQNICLLLHACFPQVGGSNLHSCRSEQMINTCHGSRRCHVDASKNPKESQLRCIKNTTAGWGSPASFPCRFLTSSPKPNISASVLFNIVSPRIKVDRSASTSAKPMDNQILIASIAVARKVMKKECRVTQENLCVSYVKAFLEHD